MQVAVIGGGVIGVCTAYYLAEAGHEVVVIERYSNVAQETSYGNGGIVSPGYASPWALPGMPKKILSYLFKAESPVFFKPSMDPALWRWLRKFFSECTLDRFHINKRRMQRLAFYSHGLLKQLRNRHELQYEQTKGVLQLFRSKEDLQMAQPALDMLAGSGIDHRMVDPDAARMIEPALSFHTPLTAAMYLSQDETGNCPLFSRQLRNVAQDMGVGFHFNSTVDAIYPEGNRVSFRILDRTFSADAVVIAAGIDSVPLLKSMGVHVPIYPVKGYSATAYIKNFEQAPVSALLDETYKVGITRMGSRIRIAGTAELGSRTLDLRGSALRTLAKVGDDWFPDAANYGTATFWCGARAMLPDGAPLIGPTPLQNVYINIGHGSAGWAMAAGSGKLMADLISGYEPEIDIEGLTLSRYG